MIINIAGTSGSGKSHLMRTFFQWARKEGEVTAVRTDGRAAPIGYKIRMEGTPGIYVVGAYESPTGGCDTIKNVEDVFAKVIEQSDKNWWVIYEGLFVMNMTRGPEMVEAVDDDVYVMLLTTPLATCFEAINDRRALRGEGKLVTRKNTQGNYRRAQNYAVKMQDAGATVIRVSREQAWEELRGLLRRGV